ncbi:MAG: hypothetical protein KDL31_12565, partial [Kiritimatiellae bacterium]|nr:hypothetical protein [Kiritimatiellia bacterium]
VFCELVATGTVLVVVLDGTASDVGIDRNPILNGVTLEVLPPILVSDPPGFVSVTFSGGTNGAISATFSNAPFADFTGYGSTNVMLPLNLWSSLGPATETPAGSGTYQISVPVGTNAPQYFLRVDSP